MVESLKTTLPLTAAYVFGAAHGVGSEVADIRDMEDEWDKGLSAVRRGYVIELFEKHGLFDAFKQEHWPFGNTPSGESKRSRYLRITREYEEFLTNGGTGSGTEGGGDGQSDAEQAVEFALEAHLRDFLAKHLDQIEKGLQPYAPPGNKATEYKVDHGRIDILGVDSGGKFVVIELKLSRGRNKALGQLLYYMGWVDKNLGGGPCRGFIIASDISGELSVAVSRVPGISLAKYKMSFSIEQVASA